MRLAIVTSHPIQYYAPIFRTLVKDVALEVFFAHRATAIEQAEAGFGTEFEWDSDPLSGYSHTFLTNIASSPSTSHFAGCDTPSITEHITKGQFDAVLVFGWYLKSFLQAIVAAKRARLPVLVRGDSQLAMPGTIVKKLVKTVTFPALLRVFDAALFVGQRSREFYRHYHYPENRLFFSPHCVDNKWFSALGTPEAGQRLRAKHGIALTEPVVLFAGKLIDFKRPLDVIAAAGILTANGRPVSVMVAGSGPLGDQMKARAQSEGVRLISLGFQNQTAMPACYAAANLLVLPSTARETWGLVANEALACGCPIILSREVGSGPDLAADGSAGCVFPTGDVGALADAIVSKLDTPPKATAIAAKSQLYSTDAACVGIHEALGCVVARR
jgi:glycosyltransferase involved in cell wall biosynthesis